jgi:hypothetical protein
MTFLAAGKVNYRARVLRAELLASLHPFAREILLFYAALATFQKNLHERLPKEWGHQPVVPVGGALRSELNLPILLKPFEAFLNLMESAAPGPLASQAKLLEEQGATAWARCLEEFWKSGLLESRLSGDAPEAEAGELLIEFLSRSFLQPYAEFIVGAMLPPVLPMTVCRCPRCNALPLLGVLRPEGDGGKRFLQCSFCSQEWEFRRILCAHCGEEKEEKLPVYIADQFPHIRVETCDTCKFFLRTIDLTRDGNAIPIVDDLAALPLSLWAEQNGYTRIQGNLLGT